MILDNGNQGTVLASGGVQTTSAFNIARTPHMFNILSSGLYSDKVSAVLREIGCNATDAHIMNGTPDLPIQVKLPSPLDRSFYIKDWGPGLNDQEVTELYTTYGWSSKQNNDEVTGAFGLGSKSPFAYTLQNKEDADGFTIESVKDGIKRIYTCHISEAGAPAISRLYEGPSEPDWTHGVKVSFPVQSRHIDEFHERAKDVYRWFRIAPELLGLNGTLPKLEYAVMTDSFGIAPIDNHVRRPCVVMGGVSYPIDAHNLRDLDETELALLNVCVTLWVPMGTVMMTPSREGLEYTDKTRKGIHEHLTAAAHTVAKRIYDEVTLPAKSTWEWYKRIQAYYTTLPYNVSNSLDKFLGKAGMSTEECARIKSIVTNNLAILPKWVGGREAPVGVHAYYFRRHESREYVVTRKEIFGGKVFMGEDGKAVGLSFKQEVCVVYADGKRADARVRKALRDETRDVIILITSKDLSAAKAYAELISSTAELEGLPCYGTDMLPAPEVSEEERELRKIRRGLAPKDIFGAVKCEFRKLTGDAVALETVALKDIPESAKYFIFKKSTGRSGRGTKLWNSGTKAYELSGYGFDHTRKCLDTLLYELNEPITGYIEIVGGEAKVKRLKLVELGFKQLLPAFDQALQLPENWAKFTEGFNPMPELRINDFYHMKQLGWLGAIAYHVAKASELGIAFKNAFSHTPAYQDVNRIVQVANDSDDVTFPLLEALRSVCDHCTALSKLESISPSAVYTLRDSFNKKYPILRFLEADALENHNKDYDEKILGMLEIAFQTVNKAAHLELIAA